MIGSGHMSVVGTGSQVAGVITSDHARTWPVSWLKKSCTTSVHVPLPASPSKAESAAFGVKEPVKGAWAVTTVWMLGPADSSSSTVWQKLFPLPSVLLISRTCVPDGDASLTSRSLTNVWVSPTVVAPIAAEQLEPSIRKSTSKIGPVRPDARIGGSACKIP